MIDAFDPRTCDTQENHNMCTGVTKTVCGEPCPHGYGIFRNTGSCGFMWRSEEKQCAQCSAGFSASTACAQAECKGEESSNGGATVLSAYRGLC